MKSNKKIFNNYTKQLVITDLLLYIIVGLAFFLMFKQIYVIDYKSDAVSFGILIPLFIFFCITIAISFYLEYKFNNLKFKNIFLYISLAILIISLINSIFLPSKVSLPYGQILEITPLFRMYSIFYSFAFASLPFMYFYVIPRRILNRKYLVFLFQIIIFLMMFFIIASFFKDFNCYIAILKSGFSDSSHPVTSLINSKNVFAQFLFVGICAVTFLHIYTKKWWYLLFLIPIFGVLLFTFAKMPIIISFLYIVFYFAYLIFTSFRKTKTNVLIMISILSFVAVIATVLIVFTCNAQSGFLFKIKKLFIDAFNSAKSTFTTRKAIWDTCFKILTPFQYVFGFSFSLFGNALRIAYGKYPGLSEDASKIWHAHNATIEILCEGGVFYLLIQLFMLVLLFYYLSKIYKYNKKLVICEYAIIALNIFHGLTDPVYLFGDAMSLFLSIILIWPTMAEYYLCIDKNKIKNKQKIINDSQSLSQIKNIFIKYNNWRLKLETKHILEDLKNIELK